MYAHYYNGVLFSAYQDGSNFKPRHWLTATGQMTNDVAACFAEDDPHTTPPPPNPTPNPTPTTANFAGTLDGADCNGISGWVANRNTPHISTKIDIYINGWLAAAGVPATQSRQDVANALGISGYNYFGFNIPFPAKYRKGTVLDISVKYAGTRIHIPGSPVTTATCPNTSSGPPAAIAAGDCEPEHTARIVGSDQAMSTLHARTGNTSLLLGKGETGRIASLTSRLIPVRQGEVLSLDGYAYAPAPAKASLRPQIASVVAGGVVAGLALTYPKPTQTDQRERGTFQAAPAIGLSTVLAVPLVKSLLANQLPNASLELAFYDQRGRFVHRQQMNISKLARHQWELLTIQTQVAQDGYVAIRMQNHSKTPVWFDDVWLEAVDQDRTVKNFPVLKHHRGGFAVQVDSSPQELYRATSGNCDNTIDGGMLDVNVTVRAKRSGGDGDNTTPPASNGSNSSGDEGWTGSSDGNYGGGGPTGGSIAGTPNHTFTPYGAPSTPKLGQTYHSPYTGVNYIWDGESWCIVLPLSEVKGAPPTNTYQGRTYVYYDPIYGYATRYTYLNGHWTLPVPSIVENIDIRKVGLANCNDLVYEKIANANYLRAQVLGIVQAFSAGKEPEVIITQGDIPGTTTDADAVKLNATTWQITLNNNALQNASQEYIAATILHEVLHVYLDSNDGNADHETMGKNYVYPMANALRALGFNITYENAVALAWGGLQKTNAWQELVAIDRVAGTDKTGDILRTNAQYKSGVKGLGCP